MKRFLKRTLGGLLPDGVRLALKRHLETSMEGPVAQGRKFQLVAAPGGCRCIVDGKWSFVAPEACHEDLADFITSPRRQTEFNALADAAEAGGIFFDIGAHAGLTSAIFCAGNERNQVFSFEPSPLLQQRLEEIAALNEFGARMNIQRLGIGERSGSSEMLIDPTGGFVQSQHFENSMWGRPQSIEIKLESVADAAARLGVVPTCLKIDIEGYEYEAIRGSADFLKKHTPTILLELHLNYLEQRGLSARALVETMRDCGYTFQAYAGQSLKAAQVYDSPLAIIHIIARKA